MTWEHEAQQLKAQVDSLRAELIVAKQHKVLSLLGKSEWQEVVEDKLRVELAELQVAHEALIQRLRDLRDQLLEEADWSARDADDPKNIEVDGYYTGAQVMREYAAKLTALLVDPLTPRSHEG